MIKAVGNRGIRRRGKQMKLHKKQFEIFRDYICILPTIILKNNDVFYTKRNFAIEFHWLVFHARLLWLEEESND